MLVAVHWPSTPMASLNISPCFAVASADSFRWVCIRITLDWIIYTRQGCIVYAACAFAQVNTAQRFTSSTIHLDGLRHNTCWRLETNRSFDMTFSKVKGEKTFALWLVWNETSICTDGYVCLPSHAACVETYVNRSSSKITLNAQTKYTPGNPVPVSDMTHQLWFKKENYDFLKILLSNSETKIWITFKKSDK